MSGLLKRSLESEGLLGVHFLKGATGQKEPTLWPLRGQVLKNNDVVELQNALRV